MTTLPGLGKTGQQILNASATTSETHSNGWEQLPPLPEIIDGVNQFTRHSFQLCFIHKKQFLQCLLDDHSSVSAFLVVGILSISARLSPPLSARYGSGIKASRFFIERATNLALGEIYPTKNTLENCQAFLLLSIAQEGNGLRDESHMSMCLALQIASTLNLHLEQTYAYETSNPTPDTIILRESARRTLWMLHNQNQLQSRLSSPVSLVASDITTLLPCDEDDFANGREPPSRAAFEGTRSAIKNPDLVNENRSLFESLIQAYGFWGIVKRHKVNHLPNSYPWDPESEFAKVLNKLDYWEMSLPPAHKWSEARLREHKTKGQDLAYLEVTMIPRLCNIVLRCLYLEHVPNRSLYLQKPEFFKGIEGDLFNNVCRLYDLVHAQFIGRFTKERLGGLMATLCVYICGHASIYIWRYSKDANTQKKGYFMFRRSLVILAEQKEVWPLTSSWLHTLENFAQHFSSSFESGNGMGDGKHSLRDQTTFCPGTAPMSFDEPPDLSLHDQSRPEQYLQTHQMPTNSQTHQQPPWGMPPDQTFDLNQGGPQPCNMADCSVVLGGFNPTHVDHYLRTPQDNRLLVTNMSMAMGIPMESAPDDFSGDMTHPSYDAQSWSLLDNDFGGH
ncbi:related to general repressor of transcription [Fusarium fujikuroi]|nr:related to general repressor of transcription [Fusarium fujikuroi]